jgi:hypothetical protein
MGLKMQNKKYTRARKLISVGRKRKIVMDDLDNFIVEMSLEVLNECADAEPNLIDHCLSFECPKKRMICLNMIRKINGDNTQYQNIIDRYIDDITGNYENSGEI